MSEARCYPRVSPRMSTHYPHETITGDWHVLIATECIRMRTVALQITDPNKSYPQLSTRQSQHNTSLY
jgi:hypothetical protein